jgi:dTDP-4-amino-4,6-dideoxygalactose transaminase
VDCQHAVAVNTATAALHLALGAIGIEEDDEILVPTMTFAATAEVGLYFKSRPVLVDCRRDTFNLDPDQIEQAITAKTKAIVPVHTAGQACDMDRILEIAIDHDLRVIEDAAHAFPARFQGKMIGTIGDITCFSFYATKTITTGEGGRLLRKTRSGRTACASWACTASARKPGSDIPPRVLGTTKFSTQGSSTISQISRRRSGLSN